MPRMAGIRRVWTLALWVAPLLYGCGGGGAGGGDGGGGLPVTMTLTATATGITSVRLQWSAYSATDYRVYMDGAYLGTSYPPDTSVTLSTLVPDRRYCFVVYASAFPLGLTARSNEACVRTPASIRPSVPANPSAVAVSPGQVTVAWAPSTGDLSGYRVYRDGVLAASPAGAGYEDGGLAAATRYCYTVSAFDAWGYESARSAQVCATTPADTTAPSAPAALRVLYDPASTTDPTITLTWALSVDDSGTVARYHVYRDGALAAQPTTTDYNDRGRAARTQYCYTVTAVDRTGNESAPAGTACATTSWASVLVDEATAVQWTALALDTADHLHIGYHDGALVGSNLQDGTVRYATEGTGSWRSQAVGRVTPTVYASIAIAATSDGRIHLAWFDFDTRRVLHGTLAGGTWTTEVIAADAPNVTTMAMARDAANRLHVVYNPNGQVTYATNAAGPWTAEVVGSNGVVYGQATTAAIAAAASGRVHIGYYDYAGRVLKYVTNDSGSWVTETADDAGDVGLHPAIALDGDGRPGLAYYDATHGDLRFATRSPVGWTVQVLDSAGDVGASTAMTADAAGRLHVSYVDVTNRALKYASNAGGSWQTYVIDGARSVSGVLGSTGYTSIGVSSAGRVHVSYRGDLRLRVASTQ